MGHSSGANAEMLEADNYAHLQKDAHTTQYPHPHMMERVPGVCTT